MTHPFTEQEIKALAAARAILVEHFDIAGVIVGKFDGDALNLNCVYGGDQEKPLDISLLALRDGAERMIHEIDQELSSETSSHPE